MKQNISCFKIKKSCRYYGFAFPILLLIWSCAIRQPMKTLSDIEEGEFRAIFVPSKCWLSPSSDSMKIQINRIMNAAKRANYNALLLDLREITDSLTSSQPHSLNKETGKFDPVLLSLENFRRQEMKIIFSLAPPAPGTIKKWMNTGFFVPMYDIDLPSPEESWFLEDNSGRFLNPANPEVKTFLKNMVRHFVMRYDLDGLVWDFSEFTDFPEKYALSSESSPLRELLEDIVAEASLVKPYLIFGASFQAGVMNDHPAINHWLKNGPLNFLMPVSKNFGDTDRAEIISDWGVGTVYYLDEGCHNLPENLSDNVAGYPENQGLSAPLRNSNQLTPFSLDVSSLLGEKKGGMSVGILPEGRTKITDAEGKIGFLLEEKPDTLKIIINGSTSMLSTSFWKPPFDYVITDEGKAIRKMPWLEFREMPEPITRDPEFHLLCKTSYPATAWINEDTVKVYKTGVYFNTINLKEGMNRIRTGVITDDSGPVTYTRQFFFINEDKTRAPFPLWIDERSISPSANRVLTPEDKVHVLFRGSKGQEGWIRIRPGKREIYCSRTDLEDYSVYEADFSLHDWKHHTPHTLSLLLQATGENKNVPKLKLNTGIVISVMQSSAFPWVRIVQDHTRLTYNLGPVRLGGPLRAEYPEGIEMKTSGIFGNFYRVYLNEEEEGFVEMEKVESLDRSYTRSPYYITSVSCGPSESGDIVSIPYDNPVPYALYPEPDQKRIRIRLYGAMTSSTWITHLQGRTVIDQVTWSQITPETYEVQIHLKTSRIWGYDLHQEGSRLLFNIKYPPEYVLAEEKPLKGVKIAIEAGHGGESYGAMGLSGRFEKDINLDLAHRFGEICRTHGAEIVQVRKTDTTMSLTDKRAIAVNSDADLLISIHANAAGTSRGYLEVGGTSTYYHNPFWADLAERMYDHLLELDLGEFGVVGSFNYTVIRVSQMPAILVEQAFMTHAEDEEKLASPDFRQAMAEKMYDGILDFLTNMKKE